MEILGLSHPAVSAVTAIMQKNVEQGRPSSAGEVAERAADQSAAATEQFSLNLSIDDSVPPINATTKSVLEARTPVDMTGPDLKAPSGEEAPPDNQTYDFPEELPMNFLEIIDMWRVDEPTQQIDVKASDGLTISDPASAGEAQRVNRTV